MFGGQGATSPRTPSPWSARLSTSASTSASTTAPPTPPSHQSFGEEVKQSCIGISEDNKEDPHLPALHLLNMSCDDAISDISDEADGFFSLDMDVSIDQQLQGDRPARMQHVPAVSSRSGNLDAWSQGNSRDVSGSPLLHAAVRRASETVPYSSSPLQGVGLNPIMASRSRNSPAPHNPNGSNAASTLTNGDLYGIRSPSSFGPIAPEVDQKGNLEYKLKILPPSRERFDRLVTQLKWRLLEGGGTAVYEIGVLDDGTLIGLDPDSMKDSLKLLSLMAAEVGSTCHVQRALALEKVTATEGDAKADRSSSSQCLATSDSDLSLRALSPTEAVETLQSFLHTATCLDDHQRTRLLESGAAGSYRFDIAEQQLPIPPSLANLDMDASNTTIASVSAVDPIDASILTSAEDDMTMSAQTRRRLLKSTLHGLPGNRPKKDALHDLDRSAIVYLPSKEEKRLLRASEAGVVSAAALAAQDQADRALSHTEAQERKMMAKMTRVADSDQPKTARARARALKSASNGAESTPCPESPSPPASPASTAVNAPWSMPISSVGTYAGYETVMSAFGVLSERAVRTLYGEDEGAMLNECKGRLIVEAVVRRHVSSEDR